MQAGESILIHAGSGAVGIAAISIALHMGCKVFTTVSTKQKRDFLLNRFPQLTNDTIGHSRDEKFERLLLNHTNGRGVDLVLNCLSRDLLRASLRCLRVGGRFLEIGKSDLVKNSTMGMAVFLKNVSFHGIRLDDEFYLDNHHGAVLKMIKDGIVSGVVKPLPTVVFSENEADHALRFLASAKHIGKVLIKIREEESLKHCLPKPKIVRGISQSFMNPLKCYIIIGGLGGFGLELANWLIERGAKSLVLTSRSGIQNGYQLSYIKKWKDANINVQVSKIDASNEKDALDLLQEANKLGPVGGIFNVALVLRDTLIANQTEERFREVCAPKAFATEYLDKASLKLAPELDYFVVFSSIACGRGNIGQTSYGYANSVMERICEARREIGLPGLAIQWGAIGDVGVVAEKFGYTQIAGTKPQRVASCLAVLDTFLNQNYAIVSSLVLPEEQKLTEINSLSLFEIIAEIIGVSDFNNISPTSRLVDTGMDSLMGTEIKQILERNYNVKLSQKEIRLLTIQEIKELSDSLTG